MAVRSLSLFSFLSLRFPLFPPFLLPAYPSRSTDTLESLPQLLFGALWSGLQFPRAVSCLVTIWVVGRILLSVPSPPRFPSFLGLFADEILSTSGEQYHWVCARRTGGTVQLR